MIELDLTVWEKQLKLKKEAGVRYLHDPIRGKWLVLQPEEIVRQLMVQYLLTEKYYNKNRTGVVGKWPQQALRYFDL